MLKVTIVYVVCTSRIDFQYHCETFTEVEELMLCLHSVRTNLSSLLRLHVAIKMGKSEKISRAKKFKINNLRKKYDDFLEDEKKRRDRNVYILENLERMRSSVATLQINQKGIALDHHKSLTENPIFASNSPTSNNNRIIMRRDMMNYGDNSWKDNSILKEISKKYILIPKIHTMTPTSPVTYPVMDLENNESDWKNKYNILEELKRNEKEEPPEKDMTFCPIKQDSNVLYKPEKDVAFCLKQQDSNVPDKHVFSEKGNCVNESQIRSKLPSAEIIDKSMFTHNHDKEKSQFHSSNTNEEFDTDKVTKKLAIINTTATDSFIKEKNLPINNNKSKTLSEINEFQGDKKEKGSRDATETENIVYNQETDKQEANNEKQQRDERVRVKELDSQNTENKQETIVKNIISNEMKTESNKASDIRMVNNEYAQNNQIEDINEFKTNVVPISDEFNENEMQINEMETKQDKIFYSEDSKHVIEDNQRYEQPEIYATDDNYTNDQYNDYEQSELQQGNDEPYTNITNENHEATANYDENYEQQHVNTYGNEYTNQYENQTFDNYETHNNYEQNPNFEYQEPERQESTVYINSENYIQSEPSPDTNLSTNQEQYYNERYACETNSQQEIYQHEYVEQSQDEIQQQINVENNYVENQENNVNGDVGKDNAGMGHEMLGVQHEYVVQNYEENQQHINTEESYVKSEENNVNSYKGEDNTALNRDMQDMQHDVVQSHDENQQLLHVEGGYEESPENIEDN